MFAVILLIYFLVVVLALALFLLPEFRDRACAAAGTAGRRLAVMWGRWRRRSTHAASESVRTVQRAGEDVGRFMVEQRVLWGGAASLMVAGLLAGIVFGRGNVLFFEDGQPDVDAKVDALLKGEQLVPPPPLPPDVFMTVEVEAVRPMLSSADRRWNQLDAGFMQRLLTVFKIMKDQYGYEMALLEGYRSPQRQALLAAQGSHVTMAGAWQSYHQYGLASDCAFYRGGKLVISEKDPWAMRGYQLYGQVAEQVGLTWGGRWQMMDLGHVEWRKQGAKAAAP